MACNAVASVLLLLYFMFAKAANGPTASVGFEPEAGVQMSNVPETLGLGTSRTAASLRLGSVVECSSAAVQAAHAGRHWFLQLSGRPMARRAGVDYCSKSSWEGHLPLRAPASSSWGDALLQPALSSSRCKFLMLHQCKNGAPLLYAAPTLRREWAAARDAFLRAHKRRAPAVPREAVVVHTPCEGMGERLGRVWRGGSTVSFDATLAMLDGLRRRAIAGGKKGQLRVILLAGPPPQCPAPPGRGEADAHERMVEALSCAMAPRVCSAEREGLAAAVRARWPGDQGDEGTAVEVQLLDTRDGNDEFMWLAGARELIGATSPASLIAAVATSRGPGATLMPRSSTLLHGHPGPLTQPAMDVLWFDPCAYNVNRELVAAARNASTFARLVAVRETVDSAALQDAFERAVGDAAEAVTQRALMLLSRPCPAAWASADAQTSQHEPPPADRAQMRNDTLASAAAGAAVAGGTGSDEASDTLS